MESSCITIKWFSSLDNTFFYKFMSGTEIIERLKNVRTDVSNVELKQAMLKIDYLIDDIFMYKNNSL